MRPTNVPFGFAFVNHFDYILCFSHFGFSYAIWLECFCNVTDSITCTVTLDLTIPFMYSSSAYFIYLYQLLIVSTGLPNKELRLFGSQLSWLNCAMSDPLHIHSIVTQSEILIFFYVKFENTLIGICGA